MVDETDGITELEKFTPERLDGVDFPANGAPFLLLKALGVDSVPAEAEATPDQTEKAVAPVTEAPQDQAPETEDGTAEPEAAPEAEAAKSAAPEPAPEEEAEAEAPAEAVKSAASDPDSGMVNVDIPAGASVSISPADLAKLATLRQRLTVEQAALAKRDMDPNVGGGTDRDKIPAEDFAGPNRSFPVVKPGDVSDAASSLGRAKGGPGARAAIKAKIIAIARRKGQAFVDELPEAWKDGGSAEKAKAKGGKKKPFAGAAEPFNADKDGDGEPHEGKDGNGKDADDAGKAEKSGAACKGCGGDMAKDAKFCANCGEGAGDGKAEKSAACKCGAAMAGDAKFCGSCGDPAGGRAEKSRACKCGAAMAKGQKFCTDCGTKAPGKAAKGKIPSPEDAAVAGAIDRAKEAIGDAVDAQENDPDKDTHPADAAVSAHLDEAKHAIGNAEDAQEEDIDTDDPAAHGMGKSAAAEAEIPYHLARLHDATCAAYSLSDVITAYPAVAKGISELVDPYAFSAMTQAALTEDGGTGSRAHEIPSLSEAFRHSVALKAAAANGGLDEAMDDIRKAFSEYYPDAHPAPGAVSPGEFRRPYVSAGRANQSASPGQEPRIPMADHVPAAADFKRPLITAGREAGSPGSNPSGVGKARSYYTNAARDGATQALTSMHDWIADNHPTVCPMTGGTFDGEPGRANSMGSSLSTAQPMPAQMAAKDKAVPVAVSPASAAAVVTPAVTKAERKAALKAARKAAEMAQAQQEAPADEAVPSAPAVDPELLKGALRDIVAELGLGDVTKTIGDLSERLAAMESAPDPAQMAPRSGAGLAKTANTGPEVPAGGDADAVERIVRLVSRAHDPDGNVRTAAYGELIKTVGPEDTARLLGAA